MFKWGKRAVDVTAAIIQESQPAQQALARQTMADIEAIQNKMGQVREAAHRIIIGQEKVVTQCMMTLLAGGHGLLVGVPGVAKTTLVETISAVMGMTHRRVQATPDLMPSDILGGEVLDTAPDGTRNFRFIKGPVFCQLLLMDEINRASPRTQAALLQAMQEGRVTVAGKDYPIPEPFHVFATQNPLEYEGTYPLPEAQLDRFMMQIDVPYPDTNNEKKILLASSGSARAMPNAVINGATLRQAQELTALLPVGNQVLDAILRLVQAARPSKENDNPMGSLIHWGPGPRGGIALLKTARAKALLEGRLAPSLDDIAQLAQPVLQHRMQLTYAAQADGHSAQSVIAQMVQDLVH